ncbi:MAG TPA: caspase family protein [Bacteroidota bacterium]|nr:caspase family protein [Bacteroidota bacterium]
MKTFVTTVVALALACSAGAAQVTSFESKGVVLKPVRDKTLPLLQIDEPLVKAGSPLLLTKDRCLFRGFASDVAGIGAVELNGAPLSLGAANRFEMQAPLREGLNTFRLSAVDRAGNRTDRVIEIIRDTRPPVILVLEPAAQDARGIRPLSVEKATVKARVTDENGVKSVTINGISAPAGPDSTYATLIPVSSQESLVRIEATDNAGNVTKEEFPVFRRNEIAGELFAGKYYAFIVGIDSYHGAWDRLKNAVRDAKAVEALLRQSFRFDSVQALYNEHATRDDILGAIDNFTSLLRKDDNLLIYFSGHGTLQQRSNRGYWVPADADGKSTSRYISHSELKDRIAAIQGRHILVVADACFSGEILKGAPLPLMTKDDPQYLRNVFQRPSRWALTSGGEEPVMDGGREGHSVFAYYFLKALADIDEKIFPTSEVFDKLKYGVGNNSAQMPRYDELRDVGSEHGEFVFVRK